MGVRIKPGPKAIPVEKRFWPKINKRSVGCWEWTGTIGADGYGYLGVEGKNKAAHRIMWEIENGPIPGGKWVLHHCDNRKCCRPDHLFLGDRRVNIDDMLSKGRQNNGEINGRSKLTDVAVILIRTEYKLGVLNQYELANKYGVNQAVISRVVNRKIWDHV